MTLEKSISPDHHPDHHAELSGHDPAGEPPAGSARQFGGRRGRSVSRCPLHRHHRHLRDGSGDAAHLLHLEHLRSGGHSGFDPGGRPGRHHRHLRLHAPAAKAHGHRRPAPAPGCLQSQHPLRHRPLRQAGALRHLSGGAPGRGVLYDRIRAGIRSQGRLDLGVHRRLRLLQRGHRHHRPQQPLRLRHQPHGQSGYLGPHHPQRHRLHRLVGCAPGGAKGLPWPDPPQQDRHFHHADPDFRRRAPDFPAGIRQPPDHRGAESL